MASASAQQLSAISPDSHASSGSSAIKEKHDAAGNPLVTIHKRTYQACIPCRRRKVRCDLGPVDNPHEPPCVRCRRESKECYFSATRRKRKGDSGDDVTGLQDDYTTRNHRRKTSHVQDSLDTPQPRAWHRQISTASRSSSPTSPTAGYRWDSQERLQQPGLYSGQPVKDQLSNPGEQEVTNETAAALFQSPINNPGDALHLLLEASGRTGDLHRQASFKQEDSGLDSSRTSAPGLSVARGYTQRPNLMEQTDHGGYQGNIDPSIANCEASGNATGPVLQLYRKALKTWSRLRFVRAGWFTAVEAMSYIDYFYEYLEPLTPISPPDFRSLDKSPDLLRDEPMLSVTILTIASRYKSLPGPGGRSRSFIIHDRLWEYLQRMISRMFFSQEQFGGGFCGAGQKLGDQGRLRTLGTIESLLLLSEFHPRALHFPPGDDGDEILAPADPDLDTISRSDNDTLKSGSAGQSTFTNWTEPALRSDRMCWSLIGAAHTLAYELGLFGSFADTPPVDWERSQRLERIIYIYLSQTSGRLGLSSMFHSIAGEADFASLEQTLFDGHASDVPYGGDAVLSFWTEITRIMRVTNLRLFPSKSQTVDLIRSGEYIGLLQQLQPVLHSWWEQFEHIPMSKYPKIILTIEFEYARVYINSLALQAVLEQWTSNASRSHSQSLSSTYKSNEAFVSEVVNASRNLLRQVVDGLLPGDYLKHVPVRTFFRVLSGAMFLLKSFALGAKENEVMTSLLLLDRTIKALRTSVVDDVHLCLRIADLLEGLTTSVRHKFVRLAGQSTTRAGEQGNSPLPIPSGPQTPGNRVGRIDPNIQEEVDPLSKDINQFNRNINIMPPPDNSYNIDNNYTFGPATQLSPLIQQQQQLYSNDGMTNLSGTADDWLTLDLNPLLDNTTFGGTDNSWFGNFGPEINSNLDVLGKFVSEAFAGDMGF